MYKRVIIAAGIVASVSGCVIATPVMTPNGQQGFTINCSAMNDVGQCYKKAGELCGSNGYEIFDQNNKPATFWSGANQTMVVRCKAPGEKSA